MQVRRAARTHRVAAYIRWRNTRACPKTASPPTHAIRSWTGYRTKIASAAMVLRGQHNLTLPRTVLISPALDLSWSNPRIPQVQPTDPWLALP
jgi:hypothetical protein